MCVRALVFVLVQFRGDGDAEASNGLKTKYLGRKGSWDVAKGVVRHPHGPSTTWGPPHGRTNQGHQPATSYCFRFKLGFHLVVGQTSWDSYKAVAAAPL